MKLIKQKSMRDKICALIDQAKVDDVDISHIELTDDEWKCLVEEMSEIERCGRGLIEWSQINSGRVGIKVDGVWCYRERAVDKQTDQAPEGKGCKHANWVPAGHPVRDSYGNIVNIQQQSAYTAFCLDCGNFVHLLTGEIINDLGSLMMVSL